MRVEGEADETTMSLLSALAASFSSGAYCTGSSRTEGHECLGGLGALEAILRSQDTPRKVLRSACALLVRFVSKDLPRTSSAIATPGLVRTLCDIASRRSDPTGSEASSEDSSASAASAASDALCALGIFPAPSIVFAGPIGTLIGTPIGPVPGPAKTHATCLTCACEALDLDAVRAALVVASSGSSGTAIATGHESECCAAKLSPLAVCAYMAKHEPERAVRIMRLLIAHGATNVNAKCSMGLTPLHWASTARAARILLEHGADPRIRDKMGRTALEYHLELDALDALEALKTTNETGVARVIAAYESHIGRGPRGPHGPQGSHIKPRKIKRDEGRSSREEKPKRARTAA